MKCACAIYFPLRKYALHIGHFYVTILKHWKLWQFTESTFYISANRPVSWHLDQLSFYMVSHSTMIRFLPSRDDGHNIRNVFTFLRHLATTSFSMNEFENVQSSLSWKTRVWPFVQLLFSSRRLRKRRSRSRRCHGFIQISNHQLLLLQHLEQRETPSVVTSVVAPLQVRQI